MDDPKKSEGGILGDISKNLGTFFRHLLPGVFIVGTAYAAHPAWFGSVDPGSWQHIAIGGMVAFAFGNIWFALNRYGIHQIIDYLAYLTNSQGPAPRGSRCRYLDDLGRYVAKSVRSTSIPALARQHVAFRASSVLLIYTVAEVGFLFATWCEPDTFFQRHSTAVVVASSVTFIVGVWQNIITRRIDYYLVMGEE